MAQRRSRNLLRGTIIYAVGNLGTKIITFLIVPLYTYYISPDDLGNYDLLVTTVSLFTPVITLRISDAAYRWMLNGIKDTVDCISATYRVLMISSAVAFFLILLVNQFVAIAYYGYFILLLILGRWLESLQTLVRGLKKQGLFAVSGIIYTFIFVSLNLIKIVFLKEGMEALFQSTVISQIITIAVLLLCAKELRAGFHIVPESRKLTVAFLKYSAPLVPSGLSWWIMSASDRYVIRASLGSSPNGIFAIASKFPAVVSMVFAIINLAWTDLALSELKDNKETSNYSSELFSNIYRMAISFTWILIPATNIVFSFVISETYQESADYIGFLYLGAVFQGFTSFISAGLLKTAHTRSIARSSMIGALVNLAVDIFAIGLIGLHAASLSTFLGFFVMWVLRMQDLNTVTPIRINWKEAILSLVISVLIIGATLHASTVVNLCVFIPAVVFFCILNHKVLHSICKAVIKK